MFKNFLVMNIEKTLKQNGLRVTDPRREVLEVFTRKQAAISHQDLESALPEADRVTMYRTLKIFEEKGIIHKAHDDTEVTRYALCLDHCTEHDHKDDHIHFHCDDCGNTYCIDIETPNVTVPQGYRAKEINVIMNGICEKCNL